jgi:putative ABC transport system ATP-binding protein
VNSFLWAEHISLNYREQFALHDVSIAIEEGETIGCTGRSGAGKSSLLYVLSGLKLPTHGQVWFRGQSYAQLGVRQVDLRRHRFGFVFQQHFLLDYLTVIENVQIGALSLNGSEGPAIDELLDQLGLQAYGRYRPYQLSVGQRQRVAIARALINKPEILFADEPTASLDKETGREVIDLLLTFQRQAGRTMVIVSHDPEMLEGVDRIVRLEEGTLR